MILLYERYGDKSNRLFQNMHFECYCKHHNLEFSNMEFYDMENIYGVKNKISYANINKTLRPSIHIRYKLIRFLAKIMNWEIYDYGNPANENNYNLYDLQLSKNSKNIILVSGWNFRCYEYINSYKNFLREKYYPKVEFSPNFYAIKNQFNNYDIRVAIHIRRGDYADWKNGKYFYDNSVYENYIHKFQELNTDKKILFITFSNEETSLNIDCITSKCTWYEDHTLMSLCDYIIGPPSTFSLWASFMGDVPVYQIKNKYDTLEMSNFKKDIQTMPE